MRETMPKRRRAQREPSSSSFRDRLDELLASMGRTAHIANILAICFLLFVTAALYTDWTGSAGRFIASLLLSTAGGAVTVLVIFFLIICTARLFHRNLESPLKDFCGVFFIYMFLALLLGLNKMTGGENEAAFPYLASGYFGSLLSTAAYKKTGVLGTFIMGLLFIYLSMAFFNIHIMRYLKLPELHIPAFNFKRKKKDAARRGAGDAELCEDEDPSEACGDNDIDNEADEEAPNIAKCERSGSYFNYDEEETSGGNGGTDAEDEENVDYNDPDSFRKTDGSGPAVIQDPNFSLDGQGQNELSREYSLRLPTFSDLRNRTRTKWTKTAPSRSATRS